VKLEVPLHRTRTFGVLKTWLAVAGGAGGRGTNSRLTRPCGPKLNVPPLSVIFVWTTAT